MRISVFILAALSFASCKSPSGVDGSDVKDIYTEEVRSEMLRELCKNEYSLTKGYKCYSKKLNKSGSLGRDICILTDGKKYLMKSGMIDESPSKGGVVYGSTAEYWIADDVSIVENKQGFEAKRKYGPKARYDDSILKIDLNTKLGFEKFTYRDGSDGLEYSYICEKLQ